MSKYLTKTGNAYLKVAAHLGAQCKPGTGLLDCPLPDNQAWSMDAAKGTRIMLDLAGSKHRVFISKDRKVLSLVHKDDIGLLLNINKFDNKHTLLSNDKGFCVCLEV